jgi:hypothetical protein
MKHPKGNIMIITNTSLDSLLGQIVGMLQDTEGLIAIHGGNFRLAMGSNGSAYPLVAEELEEKGSDSGSVSAVKEMAGIFPLATFNMAADMPARFLREKRDSIRLFSLAEDWREELRANPASRAAFYRSYATTLGVYLRAMKERGLGADSLLGLGKRRGLFSEQWLRNSFERRVRRYGGVLLDGQGEVAHENEACPVLSRGRANCSGEIAELYLRLDEAGFRAFVMFYPEVCRGFVERSIDFARAVKDSSIPWQLRTIVTVAIPSAPAESMDVLLNRVDVTVERLDDE